LTPDVKTVEVTDRSGYGWNVGPFSEPHFRGAQRDRIVIDAGTSLPQACARSHEASPEITAELDGIVRGLAL